MLPVAAAVTGVIVARASGGRPLAYAGLLALFAATHLPGDALPWLALGEGRSVGDRMRVRNAPRGTEKLLNANWWYFVRGLGQPNPGTSRPDRRVRARTLAADDVLITNFAWDNLYFYTDVRMGYRIAPEAPIATRRARSGCPDYVLRPRWRRLADLAAGADPLPEQSLRRVRALLEAGGARLEPVARFREGLWENRSELHWHRFAARRHPFRPALASARGPLLSGWRSPTGSCGLTAGPTVKSACLASGDVRAANPPSSGVPYARTLIALAPGHFETIRAPSPPLSRRTRRGPSSAASTRRRRGRAPPAAEPCRVHGLRLPHRLPKAHA